jgi:hypothetical protein
MPLLYDPEEKKRRNAASTLNGGLSRPDDTSVWDRPPKPKTDYRPRSGYGNIWDNGKTVGYAELPQPAKRGTLSLAPNDQKGTLPVPLSSNTPSRNREADRREYMKDRYAEAEANGTEYIPYFSNVGVPKGKYRLDGRVENFSDLQPASGAGMGLGTEGVPIYDNDGFRTGTTGGWQKPNLRQVNSPIPQQNNFGSGQPFLPQQPGSNPIPNGLSAPTNNNGLPQVRNTIPTSLTTPIDNYGGKQQTGLPGALAQAGNQAGAMMQNPDERLLALRGKMMEQDRNDAFLSQQFDDPITTLKRGKEALGMAGDPFARVDYEKDRDAYYDHAERMARMGNRGQAIPAPAQSYTPSLKGKSWQTQNAIMNDPARSASIRNAKARNKLLAASMSNDNGSRVQPIPYQPYQPGQDGQTSTGNPASKRAAAQQGGNEDAILAALMGEGKSEQQAEDAFKHIKTRKVYKPNPKNPLGDPIVEEEFLVPEVGQDGKIRYRKIDVEGDDKDWLKKMRDDFDNSKKDKK